MNCLSFPFVNIRMEKISYIIVRLRRIRRTIIFLLRGEKLAIFRKIVVDDGEYEWKFSFDAYDWQEPSHLVFRSLDKTLKIILQFHADEDGIGKCPFNSGVPAMKGGQPETINLNQPRFVAEILQYLLVSRVQVTYSRRLEKIIHWMFFS